MIAMDERVPVPRRLTFEAKITNRTELPAVAANTGSSLQANRRFTVEYNLPEPQLKFASGANGSRIYAVEFAVAVLPQRRSPDRRRPAQLSVHSQPRELAMVHQSGLLVQRIVDVSDRAALLRVIARDQLRGDIGAVNMALPSPATQH